MSNSAMAFADTDVVDAEDNEYTGGKNGESSTVVAGSFVYHDLTANDNITFKLATATNVGMPKGIVTEDVPAGAYTAKILKKGNYDTARVLGHADLVAGSSLKGVAGQRYVTMANAAVTPGETCPWCVAREAWATTSDGAKKVRVSIP